MIKQNWILKETYENINWNNVNTRHEIKYMDQFMRTYLES